MTYHSRNHTERTRLEHESWCFKNGVLIYGEGIAGTKLLRIVINNKGKITVGQKRYRQKKAIKAKDEKWWEMIWKLREHWYNHYNK